MGLFSSKPKVSEREFSKTRQILSAQGFSKRERDKLKQIFRGDMYEKGAQAGIDKDELARGIDWMRKNRSAHGFSDEKIKKLEEHLKKQL